MCWPDLVVRVQLKSAARDVALDIRKKVFVGRDLESRGSTLPFDCERPTGVNLGEGANRSVIGFDVAIASNANPPASSGPGDPGGKKYNRDLLHVKCGFSSYDAALPRFGFKEIQGRAISRSLSGGLEPAAP